MCIDTRYSLGLVPFNELMSGSEKNREEKEVSFPSPARDFWEPPLSLDKACHLSNPSVFLLRYRGAKKPLIDEGAILVVDRSVKPTKKDTVIIARAGEMELHVFKQIPKEEGIELWGTVTHVLNDLRR